MKHRDIFALSIGVVVAILLAICGISYFIWGNENPSTSIQASNMSTQTSRFKDYRLSRNLWPVWYNLSIITYVPGYIPIATEKNFTFEAELLIKFRVKKETNKIELNAWNLNLFSNIKVGADQSAMNIAVANVTVSNKLNKVWFSLDEQLLTGNEYFIKIPYTGQITNSLFGLYQSYYLTENGTKKYLATTQFEPNYARQMVPCFDEPEYKAVWKVTVIHPNGTSAISNAKEIKKKDAYSLNGDSNWLMTSFFETPKMSSYLLALVVSDFAYKEAHMVSTNNSTIRFRVWLRPEIIENANWALEIGIKLLSYFEKKLEVAFPIPKMDMIGLKQFASGAMENWGLVTFREEYLAYNKTSDREFKKMFVSEIVAHEFAHQWFGDLVTLKWWNDLFLNEGFATFLTYPALGVSMNYTEQQLSDYLTKSDESYGNWAFDSDVYSTGNPLHFELVGPEDFNSIFNGISYGKGAIVLRMMEQSLGTDVFYQGLHIYLKRHQYGNTEFKDLLMAIDEAKQESSSKDKMPYSVVDFGTGWITQANYPVVFAKRISPGTVELSQQKFMLDYYVNGGMVKDTWQIPIWYQVNGIEKEMVWLNSQRRFF